MVQKTGLSCSVLWTAEWSLHTPLATRYLNAMTYIKGEHCSQWCLGSDYSAGSVYRQPWNASGIDVTLVKKRLFFQKDRKSVQ